jgi:tetratricopeptide (TPR) repeat protein
MGETTTPDAATRIDELLGEGIRSAREGDRTRARELLMRVVELDERQVRAWLWLSEVVDDEADRVLCLENVLAIDPGNQVARTGLRWLREQQARTCEEVETAGRHPSDDLWEEPPHPLHCPYCAAMTEEADRRCATCGGQLWVRTRRRAAHSLWLWNLISVRLSTCAASFLLPVIVLAWLAHRFAGSYDPLLLLPAYLGMRHSGVELAQAAFEVVPRAYLAPFMLLSAYSLALLIAMYLRWWPAYYLMVGGAGARLVLSVALMLIGHRYGLYCGGVGTLVSAISLPILMAVADDFAWDTARVHFGLDNRAKGGEARLERARVFAEQGMWALSALYLRAAAVQLPGHSAVYTRLARAYLQLRRPDQALRALEDAVRADPGDPTTVELAHELRQAGQARAQGGGAAASPQPRSKVHL